MESESAETRLQQAAELLEGGKPREVLDGLAGIDEELVDADDRIECAYLRASALLMLDEIDSALATVEEQVEDTPDSALLNGVLGVALSHADRLEEAREALERCISLDEQDSSAVANLAHVHEKLREYRRAIELYDRALSIGADIGWVLPRKASTLCELEEYEAARKVLKRYLSLAPDDDYEWVSLGIIHSELERYDESFSCYRQAETLNADSKSLRLNWGLTAERAGKLDEARRQLELLKHVAPRSSQVCVLEGFLQEHAGNLDPAFEQFQQAIERAAASEDRAELLYAFEQAMEFCAQHAMRKRADALLQRGYRLGACSVEVCEAHRELTGELLDEGYWISLLLETDQPPGAGCIAPQNAPTATHGTRAVCNFQVVARDRDEAVALALEFLTALGDENPALREIVSEEPMEDAYNGIYEMDAAPIVREDASS